MNKEMKIIRKYMAVTVTEYVDTRTDGGRLIELENKKKGYYDCPELLHDTEEAAIQHAYETNSYAQWMIVPVITFDNF